MRGVSHGLALAVLLAILAGCTSSDDTDASPTSNDSELTATGTLRGVVVDGGIRPLAGANVAVEGEGVRRNTTSLVDGSFGFDLEPGVYIVSVNKSGFLPLQRAETVTGDPEAEGVVFQLAFDAATGAYASQTYLKMFLECSAAGAAVCALPEIVLCIAAGAIGQDCPQLRDEQTQYLVDEFFTDAARIPSFVQMEAVWDATQPLGEALNIAVWSSSREEWNNGSQGPFFGNHKGESPVTIRINATQLEEAEVGTKRGARIALYSTENIEGLPYPVSTMTGAAANQEVDLYITAFYGYVPPEEWSLVEAGQVPPP